jgi:small subunit ribosomal protein S8
MTMTDPIADMLTRIRNGVRNKFATVDMPTSKMKEAIAAVLKEEGYIADFSVAEGGPQNTMRVYLKYGPDGEQVINRIERVSTPGRRVYSPSKMPRVMDGLGICILSTSRGVMSDRKCRKENIGGELLAKVS